jgi:hypothetical protein
MVRVSRNACGDAGVLETVRAGESNWLNNLDPGLRRDDASDANRFEATSLALGRIASLDTHTRHGARIWREQVNARAVACCEHHTL